MFYPEETVEEVRNGNDIVDVVGSCVQLKKKGANYFGLCPFHNEKTPSFSVSPGKQIYYCFGCGAGGNVISFVMNYENMSFPEAVKSLAERAGISLPEISVTPEMKKRASEKMRLLSLLKDAASYYYRVLRSGEGAVGMEYFKGRGISPGIMQSFGLGYAGKNNGVCAFLKDKGYSAEEIDAAGLVYMDEKRGMQDRFWNRVIFPIMDGSNRVIGFGGRVMGKGEPKYLNSPESPVYDKRRNLYGFNMARKSRKDYFIACEGYIDVISMHQAGFPEAVASLGTAFTREQALLIKGCRKTDVKLAYDSDGAGVKAALRAIGILRDVGIRTGIIHMEPYKDPDEFIKNEGAEEFQKRIDSAENSLSFEIHTIQKDYDISDPEGRTRFQQRMARRLAGIGDEIERNNYTEAFATEYMMDSDMLKRAVEEARLMGQGENPSGATDGGYRGERDAGSPSLSGGFDGVRGRRGDDDRKKKGEEEAQKLFLTYLSNDPERVYDAVRAYIGPEDFSPGILRFTAEEIFRQIEEKDLRIGAIINGFEDPKEQREIAEIFNTELDPSLSNNERENALTDLVIRIKKDSMKRQDLMEGTEDPISRTIREKKALEKLEKMRIRL